MDQKCKVQINYNHRCFPADFGYSWALSRCFNWTRVFLVINAVWIVKIIINATLGTFLDFSQNHWDWKGPHLVHLAFEHLHRCRVHNISGQFIPVFVHLERKKIVISWVQPVSPQGLSIVLEPILVQARQHEPSVTVWTELYTMTAGFFHNE